MNLIAGIVALLWPGAGHFFVLRERRRGLLAALGVLGLFFGGMFIGGIDVIDREEDRYWFLGQALIGPLAFAVNSYHQNNFKAYDIPPDIIDLKRMDQDQVSTFRKRSLFPHEQLVWTDFTIVQKPAVSPANQSARSAPVEIERRLPIAVPAGPEGGPPALKSIGRMNELGMLSSTLGGMLNFIILLDALFPTRRKEDA